MTRWEYTDLYLSPPDNLIVTLAIQGKKGWEAVTCDRDVDRDGQVYRWVLLKRPIMESSK